MQKQLKQSKQFFFVADLKRNLSLSETKMKMLEKNVADVYSYYSTFKLIDIM